jgi:hypothetical protein
MKSLITTLFILFAGSAFAFEHGSLSRDQAVSDVCSESASICTYLKSLSLTEQGYALRTPNGERMMPYRFSFSDNEQLIVEINRIADGTLSVLVQEK